MKILRRFHYDPLDRLTGVGLLAGDSTQRFYQENHLTTVLGQQTQRTILRHEAQPLAQQHSAAGVTENTLMVTDQAHSLLQTLSPVNFRKFSYTAYGHHPIVSGLSRLFGFNGEYPDDITGHYPLGQGNRFFNPVLMRFNGPDVLSPFDEGGINPYAYCKNDPINLYDPTGNMPARRLLRSNSATVSVKRVATSGISKRPRRMIDTMATKPIQQPIGAAAPKAGAPMSIPPYNPAPDILTQDDLPTSTLLKYISLPYRNHGYHQELAEVGLKYDVMRELYAGMKSAPTETQTRKLQLMRRQLLRKGPGETLQLGHLAVQQLRIKNTSYETSIRQIHLSFTEEIRGRTTSNN